MEARIFLRALLITRHLARSDRLREFVRNLQNAKSPEDIRKLIQAEWERFKDEIMAGTNPSTEYDLVSGIDPDPDVFYTSLESLWSSELFDENWLKALTDEDLSNLATVRLPDLEPSNISFDELSDLPPNVDPLEAISALWFVEFDNSYLDGLNLPDVESLVDKLSEIKEQLSPSQLDALHDLRALYWTDPFSKEAAWRTEAIRWFSTLEESTQKAIEDAHKIINIPDWHSVSLEQGKSEPLAAHATAMADANADVLSEDASAALGTSFHQVNGVGVDAPTETVNAAFHNGGVDAPTETVNAAFHNGGVDAPPAIPPHFPPIGPLLDRPLLDEPANFAVVTSSVGDLPKTTSETTSEVAEIVSESGPVDLADIVVTKVVEIGERILAYGRALC